VRGWVEPEVTGLEHGRPLRRHPARERSQAGEQLLERERLDEVVVRATVEPFDSVLNRVTRGQDQHRRPDTALSHLAARGQPILTRQHHVEHDHVVRHCPCHPERVFPAPRNVHCMPLLAQPTGEQVGQFLLILDHEYPHALIVRQEMKAT